MIPLDKHLEPLLTKACHILKHHLQSASPLAPDEKQQILKIFNMNRFEIDSALHDKKSTFKAEKILKKSDKLALLILSQEAQEFKDMKVMAMAFHCAYKSAMLHQKMTVLPSRDPQVLAEIVSFIDAAFATANNSSERRLLFELEDVFLKKMETPGTLEKTLIDYLNETPRFKVLIPLICRLAENRYHTPNLQRTLQNLAMQLGAIHQTQAAALGPSKARRDARRLPEAVLVHFIAAVRQELEKSGHHPALGKLKREGEAIYFKRELGFVREFLEKARSELQHFPLEKMCQQLLNQLPRPGEPLHPTQLHDCVYGRVFDTSFVENLVSNPPAGVARSMTAIGSFMAEWLSRQDARLQEKVVDQMMGYINQTDPRFWFPKTALIVRMQQATNWKEAFAVLMEHLKLEKSTGYEIVSVPYLVVKICLALDHNKEIVFVPSLPSVLEPSPSWSSSDMEKWKKECNDCKMRNDLKVWDPVPWMRSANSNYASVISPQRSVEYPAPGNITLAKAAGITLMYQPPAASSDWMIAAERPSNKNRPDLEHTSPALKTGLEHGLPWGVGVSNSTSIMLHFFQFASQNGTRIDSESLLLGTLMFLVYDGGHSVYEVLWTANQLNRKLNLGLNLPNIDPLAFIADYEQLQKLFSGETGAAVKQALAGAMDDVIRYFHKYSYALLE